MNEQNNTITYLHLVFDNQFSSALMFSLTFWNIFEQKWRKFTRNMMSPVNRFPWHDLGIKH